jgi:hypothetical protein
MGCTILGSAFLSLFVVIKGHAGLIFGKDEELPAAKAPQTLSVPEPDAEDKE